MTDHYAHICSEERFTNDIKTHEMEIIRDDGVNRHLRFKRPDTTSMYFDIITWPGYLCYCGDMGTYVFSRINDMMAFFDGERINPCYWGEKLTSESRFGKGYQKFSEELMRRQVIKHVEEYIEMDEELEEIKRNLDDDVFTWLPDNPHMAMSQLYDFEYGDFDFRDWLIDGGGFEEFTFHYIWCCRALHWACARYWKWSEQEKVA